MHDALDQPLSVLCCCRFEAASETVTMLKNNIWELFNKIGCNTHAVRELLGEEGQVSVACCDG